MMNPFASVKAQLDARKELAKSKFAGILLLEQSLAERRDEYFELLKANGEPTRAIFDNCQFIPRSTAEAMDRGGPRGE